MRHQHDFDGIDQLLQAVIRLLRTEEDSASAGRVTGK